MRKRTALLLLISTIPVLLPLLRPGLWAAHDPFHHLFRAFDLDYALRGGNIYPRWLPNLGFFYGYPVLNFYAPLSYYLVVLLHWLGLGFIAALKGAFALSFLLAAITAYLWGKDIFGEEAGLWIAAAYTYFPYHLANAYVRAALAEHLAFIFFPLILWLMRRTMRRRTLVNAAYLALAMAGLILTHNLSTFMFAPFAVLYALIIAWATPASERLKALARAGMGLAGGVALSAFYWLPAITEVRWIRAGQVAPSVIEPLKFLSPLRGLFSPFFIHRYFPHQGTPFQHPFSQWQAAIMLTGILAGILGWRLLSGEQRLVLVAAVLLELLSIALMLNLSAPLWSHIEALIYLQFPWRFQAMAGVFGSLTVAPLPLLLSHPLGKASKGRAMAGLLAVFVIGWAATGMLGLHLEPLTWPETGEPVVREEDVSFHSMAQYDYQTALWARLWGGPWLLEYLPATVKIPREEFWLPREGPSPWKEPYLRPSLVELQQQCPLEHQLIVETPEDTYIRWHQFWFPGWQATVDGKPVRVEPSPQLGLVTVPIPAGRHQVRIWFGDTPSRRWGGGIALVGALMVLLALLKERRWRALLVIVITLGFWLSLWGWENLRSPTCAQPRKAWVFLENRIAFLGCTARPEILRPGGVMEVTLYWMALEPLDENLTAFVHLIGPDGKRISQHDGPPAESFSPTTRWEPGEIIPDRHLMPIPEKMPSSPEGLVIGMYRLEPELRNLDVLDQNGNILGNTWTFEFQR